MKSLPPCRVCNSPTALQFEALALSRHHFEMLHCRRCGYLFVRDPHWLAEAYRDAISRTDTGLVARNLQLARSIAPLLFHLFGDREQYVDFGGGTGLLVRLMRDAGFDFFWKDAYSENVHARGFESAEGCRCAAVTAFEVMEHVVDPVDFARSAFATSSARCMLFTTELFAGAPPAPGGWWYYAFDSGQHISFYQLRTLEALGRGLGLDFASAGGLHMLGERPLVDRFRRYAASRALRWMTRRRMGRAMKSKTWNDHRLLQGRI